VRVGAAVACLLLAPVGVASADTLIDTGTASFDNWQLNGQYFRLGLAATGAAEVDGFSILVGTTTATAVTGSSIDLYKNHPAAPTTPADLLGTLSYASIAPDSSRSRVSFSGSVIIPSAGDYWAKWRDLPSGQAVRIRMGSPGTPTPWHIKTGAWHLNGSASSGLTTDYFPKFRITGGPLVAPAVSAVSRAHGPSTGGTSVVTTGTGLTGATGVYLGGRPPRRSRSTPPRRSRRHPCARSRGGRCPGDDPRRHDGARRGIPPRGRKRGARGAAEAARPTSAPQVRTAERPRKSTVGRLNATSRPEAGIRTFAASVRTDQAGRFTILFENRFGQRVPLHRGSRVGSRTPRTLLYGVVVNTGAGASLPVTAALREAATQGLRIRIIHRDTDGTLSGEEASAG